MWKDEARHQHCEGFGVCEHGDWPPPIPYVEEVRIKVQQDGSRMRVRRRVRARTVKNRGLLPSAEYLACLKGHEVEERQMSNEHASLLACEVERSSCTSVAIEVHEGGAIRLVRRNDREHTSIHVTSVLQRAKRVLCKILERNKTPMPRLAKRWVVPPKMGNQ